MSRADTPAADDDGVMARARAFFDRNPDEVLTRDDIRVKFDCGERTANNVARTLIREGVPRWQVPMGEPKQRVQAVSSAPFPRNLAPAERRSIEAYEAHDSVAEAADAEGISPHTLSTQLRDARRKAGVHTTRALLAKYRELTD